MSLFGKIEGMLLDNYWLSKSITEVMPPSVLEMLSKMKAKSIYKKAIKRVPAYRKFNKKIYSKIEDVPYTDKENYVKKYSYEQRCVDKTLPQKGDIDESSGSSGAPTNWIRSLSEEDLLFKAAKFEFFYTYHADKKKYVVLSGWSSGPWATGVKFCELLEHYTLVKNTTADIENIIRTMKTLGKDKDYLIAGYPPFLKNLFDSREIKWKDYKVDVLTGGESTSVEWKDYIRKKLRNKKAIIISSYGASDIDIGVGFETPFSELVRGLAHKNRRLNFELFKVNENPILFQYNPLMHYIENTPQGDYTITVLDDEAAVPKIKYNLHDQGGKISYNEIIKKVEKHEKKSLREFLKRNKTLKLPFFYVVGRKDGTIAIGGANIYPENVGNAIEESKYNPKVNKFLIERKHTKNMDAQFLVHIELKKGNKTTEEMARYLEEKILKKLLQVNLEYEHYFRNDKKNQINMIPRVKLYEFEKEKMFKVDDEKIKYSYVVK
jgi:phenylacetate-CoA ligase